MTTSEFSTEFDILYNSIASNQAPGLDEYEKSVLLTKAQEDTVIGLYNGSLKGVSLEATEELRRGLDSLIVTKFPKEVTNKQGIDSRSKFYQLDEDVWFITYEAIELPEDTICEGNNSLEVIPVKQDEWHRLKRDPFKRPNRRKAVRLDNSSNVAEIISDYPIAKYIVRYIRRPQPIILADLSGEGLKINKKDDVTDCELNTALHRVILERAVMLASSIYVSNTK